MPFVVKFRSRVLQTVALAALGAALPACAQRFAFSRLSQGEGLKNVDVSGLLQDRDGVIWVATQGGVYRYDGFRFEAAAIDENGGSKYVTGLVEDGRGRIWFTTADNVLGYFEHLEAHLLPLPPEGLRFGLGNPMSADAGNPDRIYLVSNRWLYAAQATTGQAGEPHPQYSAEEIARQPELGEISGLLAEQNGRLWLGCGAGICAAQGREIRLYGVGDGVPPELWQKFFVDRAHNLWARSERHLIRLDRGASRFVNAGRNLEPGSLGVRTPAILEDPQGRVLLNLTTGLARLEHDSWRTFHKSVDVPPYQINSMLRDQQGSIWLGLDGQGVARWLGYDQFENLTHANGLLSSNTVWNFRRDRNGDLWIATEDALERMSHVTGRIESVADRSGTPLQRIQTLAVTPNGHIWSGSDNGAVIDFDPVRRSARTVGQFGGVFQIFERDPGRLWVCAMDGLFSVTVKPAANETPPRPLLRGHVFYGIHDPDGDDWFITDSGLYRRSAQAWSHIRLPDGYRLTFSASLAMAHDHTLWLSAERPALSHLRIENDAAMEIERFGAPALVSNSILSVALDRRGWLWVGTDDGIDVYNGSKWRYLNTEDGLAWNDLDSGAFLEDDDGSIWIGTTVGASHILHPEEIFDLQPPSLHLSHTEIGSVALAPGLSVLVPTSRHPLTTNLSTLNFQLSNRTTFRYRIDGLNEEWQDSPKHDLRYPPLSPGSYRLAVMAVDIPDGMQSPVTYVPFVVTPPWWRSAPMIVLESLLALSLVFGAWRWSVHRHIRNERHLEDLVRRRTAELESEKAELLRVRAALQVQAAHDPLTGLLNHGAILRSLDQAMARSSREHSTLGVVLVDLDHFKLVNDNYGHLTGDRVLQEYARRIHAAVRTYDEAGRYGGEEILILLPHLAPHTAHERLAELHTALCGTPIARDEGSITVTCSFGFTWFDAASDTAVSLINRVDRALYAAKRNGRNQVEVFEKPCRVDRGTVSI